MTEAPELQDEKLSPVLKAVPVHSLSEKKTLVFAAMSVNVTIDQPSSSALKAVKAKSPVVNALALNPIKAVAAASTIFS